MCSNSFVVEDHGIVLDAGSLENFERLGISVIPEHYKRKQFRNETLSVHGDILLDNDRRFVAVKNTRVVQIT